MIMTNPANSIAAIFSLVHPRLDRRFLPCALALLLCSFFSSVAAYAYDVEADSQNNTIYILLSNSNSSSYNAVSLSHSSPAIISSVSIELLPDSILANSSDLLAVNIDIPNGISLGAVGELDLTISGEVNGLSVDIDIVVPLAVVASANLAQGFVGSTVPAPDPGGIDSDSDGVSDALELAFGSDPNNGASLPGQPDAVSVNVPLTGVAGLIMLALMVAFIGKGRLAQISSGSVVLVCAFISVDILSGVATRMHLVAQVPAPPVLVSATASASSSGASGGASFAVDGDNTTRWESSHGIDPSWLTLDLGQSYALSHLDIYWEAANAATYEVQGSTDNVTWAALANETGGTFGDRTDQVDLSGTYRYLRIYGVSRTSVYGYSIWEAKVYAFTSGDTQPPEPPPEITWPAINSAVNSDVDQEIALILNQMTLDEKVGQMIMAEIHAVSPNDLRNYHLGAVLNAGGSWPNGNKSSSVADWVSLADSFYLASIDPANNRTAVPILWGTDAVHGHNNVMGATIFPHNIGLGAMNNPSLIKQIGQATALEVAATGIDWVFAPTLAVVRDDRWGRTYEGYSEDPEIVNQYAGEMVEGLQGETSSGDLFNDAHVVATAKHFVGDGGTSNGVDQGNTISSEENLRDVHGQGYFSALDAGAQTIMASYNSWNGSKLHGNEYLLTTVLKEQMGFDGFVLGDWNGHAQVLGCSNNSCAQAINAGVDMIMVPFDWQAFAANTKAQVLSGDISMARINDAVTRILRVKIRSGLFDTSRPSLRTYANDLTRFNSAEHKSVARQSVRESLVLLKNSSGLLPLSPSANVLVAGSGANNIPMQCGGWTVTWQGTGTSNADFPQATSIWSGIEAAVTAAGGTVNLSTAGVFDVNAPPDVAVVVFGESPYAESGGDLSGIEYQAGNKSDLALLQSLKAQNIPVVSIFLSGRPFWMNKELNASTAFVMAWLPGSEGAGVADVIFRTSLGAVNHDFTGTLSYSWPASDAQFELNRNDANYAPLFAYGFGLTYQDSDTLGDNLAE